MSEPQQQNLAERDDVQAAGAAQGLGCGIVASLIIFIGLGIFIDQRIGTMPLFTLIGVVIGLVGAGYQLYELTLIGRKDRDPGPVGKVLGQQVGGRMANRKRPR
ncbi:MAG: AtpZ/AtpI family protein [Thermomicrobiales bacterium]